MARNFLRKSNLYKGIKFVFYPFIFAIICFGVLYFAFAPTIEPAISMFSLVLNNNKPSKEIKITPKENNLQNGKIAIPFLGEKYGNIKIDSCNINAPIYYGDSPEELKKGVGNYTGSYIPGQRSTILLGGHNSTFFNSLGEANVGDIINITTTYGEYIYKITDAKVANHNDKKAYDLYKNEENIILYTCYPFNSLGITEKRYFVYGQYVSGPQKAVE